MDAQLGLVAQAEDGSLARDASFDSKVSQIVKTLMAFHGVTPVDLAEKLEISRSNMYRRLNGSGPWMAEELNRVSAIFGVSPAAFYSDPGVLLASITRPDLQSLPTGRSMLNQQEEAVHQSGLPTSWYVFDMPDELSIRRDRRSTRRAECGLPLAQ